jgi:transketolase
MDMELLAEICNKYSFIHTIEEHQRSGGFGSAILEALHDLLEKGIIKHTPSVKRTAIPDIFINVAGSQDHLRKIAGLNLDHVLR